MGYGALSFGAIAFIGLFSSIVTARIYGVRVVGEFALAFAPAAALWFLSSVKEQAALVRELTQLPKRHPRVTGLFYAVFTFSMALTILVATVVGVIVYFAYAGPVDHPGLFGPAVACLLGYTFITNVGWNYDGVFSAFIAGKTLFWIRVHEAVVSLAIAIVLGLLYHNIWGLIISTYAPSVTALVHRIIAVRPLMRHRVSLRVVRDGFSSLPGLLKFSIRMAPGTIFAGFAGQAATWILGSLSTVAAVGAFNRAQMLSRRFQDLNQRIVEMLFPTLVSRHSEGDHEGFDRALMDTMRYSAVFMLLIGAVGAGSAHGLMHLFGPGFVRAQDAFAVLMLLPALTTLAVIQNHALYAVGRPTITSVIAFVRLIVVVAVSVPATLLLGITGPAIGLVAGYFIELAWKGVVLKPHLSSSPRALWPHRERLALVAACASAFF